MLQLLNTTDTEGQASVDRFLCPEPFFPRPVADLPGIKFPINDQRDAGGEYCHLRWSSTVARGGGTCDERRAEERREQPRLFRCALKGSEHKNSRGLAAMVRMMTTQ